MGISVKMESHVREATQKIQDSAVGRMHEAVDVVRNTTIETLSGARTEGGGTFMTLQRRTGRTYRVPGTKRTYTASAPGEPPAQRLGELRQSVKSTVETGGKKVIGKVGTDKEYGAMLEFGTRKIEPRPWLQPSFDESKNRVIAIFNREWIP